MSDFFAEIAAARESFRADMPPAIQQSMDKIVNDLIAVLGESPEAWRGALEAVSALMTQPIATAANEYGEALAHSEAVMTMMTLVLGQWLSHPIVVGMVRDQLRRKREANGG